MDKQTYEFHIYGETFTVTCCKGEAHLQAVVTSLENRLRKIQESPNFVSPLRVVLMAALTAEAERLEKADLFAPLGGEDKPLLSWH